jgi:hypothetical protein
LQGKSLSLVLVLESTLWFSLASIRLLSPDCKVALTEEYSRFSGLKVVRYPGQLVSRQSFSRDNFEPFYATSEPPANFPPLPYHQKPMDPETSPISEAEAQMQGLESNFADLHVTLQLFLTQQANMQTPHVLPSILNPASEDPCATPTPETPREWILTT